MSERLALGAPAGQPRAMVTALPNLLTLARIAAVPALVLVYALPGPVAAGVVAALFVVASLTDLLDGWIARRFNAQSRFGTMLDPIADKLLVATVLVLLVSDGTLADAAVVAALIVLGREIIVSGLREYLAGDRATLPVTPLAQWKTAAQMAALTVLLLARLAPGEFALLGLILIWLAAALSAWTGFLYLAAATRHLRHSGGTDRP